MQRCEITLNNPTGLHARPGRQLVELAKKFESTVVLSKVDGGTKCNGKSIMKILQAGFSEGVTVIIETEGSDEKEALDAIITFIKELQE